jgi:hypothetical protein
MNTVEIIPLKGPDISFSNIAQGARVDGAILPSGFQVPVTPGRKWIITGQSIWCINDAGVQANVQSQLPE